MTITTPRPPTTDPDSGNELPGPPIVERNRPARLSQQPVANVGGQTELVAAQDTTVSLWTILVGPRTTLTAESVVVDEATKRKWVVVGAVARRPEHHPKYLAAGARLISDMQ
ncbi:hypothetical protein GCM10022243_48180 [Saccharothrix violaceirubra]